MVHTLLLLFVVLSLLRAEGVFASEGSSSLERLTVRSISPVGYCAPFRKFTLSDRGRIQPIPSHCEFLDRFPFGRLNFSYAYRTSKPQGLRQVEHVVGAGSGSLLRLSNTARILDKRLNAVFNVVYRGLSHQHEIRSPWGQRLGAQVALKGTLARMKYGAELGYVGKESGPAMGSIPQDNSGGKFVWEWDLDSVKPTVEISRFFDNLEQDPSRPRTITTRKQFSVNWNRPRWPFVTLRYKHEFIETECNQIGLTNDAVSTDRVSANFSYGQTSWETYMNAHSSFSRTPLLDHRDQLVAGSSFSTKFRPLESLQFMPELGMTRTSNPRDDTLSERYFAKLGSSLRVAKTITLTPGFEYIQLFNRRDALETQTIFAKVGSSYIGKDNSLTVSMFGGFTVNQDSQDLTNLHTYDFSFSMEQGIRDYFNLAHRTQTLSVKLTHHQQIDNISRAASRSTTSATLLLKFIP